MPSQLENSVPLSTVMVLNTSGNIFPYFRSSVFMARTTLAALLSGIRRMISWRVTRSVRAIRHLWPPRQDTTRSISQWPGSWRVFTSSGLFSMLSPFAADFMRRMCLVFFFWRAPLKGRSLLVRRAKIRFST